MNKQSAAAVCSLTARWKQIRVVAAGGLCRELRNLPSLQRCPVSAAFWLPPPRWYHYCHFESLRTTMTRFILWSRASLHRGTKVPHNNEKLNLEFSSCCGWTQSHWPWLKQGSRRPDSSGAASGTPGLQPRKEVLPDHRAFSSSPFPLCSMKLFRFQENWRAWPQLFLLEL